MELLSKSEGKHSPYLPLGKITSPHGLKGALKIFLLSDFPEHLPHVKKVFLLKEPDAEQAEGPFDVLQIQKQKGKHYIVELQQIRSRTAAEAVNKQFIAIPQNEAPELDEEDSFYARDLIGLEARDLEGEVLGQIIHVIQSHQDLLVLQHNGKEHWIPFVHEMVPEVDLHAGYVVIDVVPGLLEL